MTCSPSEWATIITAFALLLSSLAASLGALLRACQAYTLLKQVRAHQLGADAHEISRRLGGTFFPPDF
jgi:hypothetical protein